VRLYFLDIGGSDIVLFDLKERDWWIGFFFSSCACLCFDLEREREFSSLTLGDKRRMFGLF